MQTIDFYYDFGSPNAYFAREALKQISGSEFVIHDIPVLIGGIFKLTNNQPPWQAFGACANKMAYMKLEIERFIKAHNLAKFTFNSAFPVNTLLPMRAAIAAKEMGVHEHYVDPVFSAMWENDKNISQPEVLIHVLNEAGLDGSALAAAAHTPDIKDKLAAATQAAVDRGVFGLPTMFVNDDMYFGKDRVWMIEKHLTTS